MTTRERTAGQRASAAKAAFSRRGRLLAAILFVCITLIAISALLLIARKLPPSGRGETANLSPSVSAQRSHARPVESAQKSLSGAFADVGDVNVAKFLQGGAAPSAIDPGQMTPAEAQGALFAFEAQRASWLALRSVSGRYKCVIDGAYPKTGKTWHGERSGSLDLVVTPLDKPVCHSWIKASVRLTDDEYGITFVADNILDTSHPVQWTTTKPELCSALPQEEIQDRFNLIGLTDWLQPMSRMTETWRDADWNRGVTKDAYFACARVLDRTSTAEETSAVFNAEPQYLLHVNYRPDMLFWFSQNKGELRRIDWLRKDVKVGYLFDNYAKDKSTGKAGFPTRFAHISEETAESAHSGARESITVDLADAKINESMPANTLASLVPGQ